LIILRLGLDPAYATAPADAAIAQCQWPTQSRFRTQKPSGGLCIAMPSPPQQREVDDASTD
jgi:hypothetical protein